MILKHIVQKQQQTSARFLSIFLSPLRLYGRFRTDRIACETECAANVVIETDVLFLIKLFLVYSLIRYRADCKICTSWEGLLIYQLQFIARATGRKRKRLMYGVREAIFSFVLCSLNGEESVIINVSLLGKSVSSLIAKFTRIKAEIGVIVSLYKKN